MIVAVQEQHIKAVHELWRKANEYRSFLIDVMPVKELQEQLINPQYTLSYVYLIDGNIVGFVSGSISADQQVAYITILIVDSNHQRNGIGTRLLRHLEQEVQHILPEITGYEISFHNPVTLPWTSSINEHPTHPMLPGVPLEDSSARFFEQAGYHLFAIQELYYKQVHNHPLDERVLAKEETLANKDINITVYDPDVHNGLNELFDHLQSSTWKRTVQEGLMKGYPLLVVVKKTTVIGFAGPLYIEPSGRGYFAGIGVDSNYRRQGIASVLFARLCYTLSTMGASYMTLFTGTKNPAKHIYLAEGFQVIHSFGDYRKVRSI